MARRAPTLPRFESRIHLPPDRPRQAGRYRVSRFGSWWSSGILESAGPDFRKKFAGPESVMGRSTALFTPIETLCGNRYQFPVLSVDLASPGAIDGVPSSPSSGLANTRGPDQSTPENCASLGGSVLSRICPPGNDSIYIGVGTRDREVRWQSKLKQG
jgi:hypothetical protein